MAYLNRIKLKFLILNFNICIYILIFAYKLNNNDDTLIIVFKILHVLFKGIFEKTF